MKKRSALDWFMLGIVVIIALIVILLSFHNTTILAGELGLNPYLTAGLIEVLFGSLLFIRGRQRSLQRNVPLFLEIGYLTSFVFVTSVNMYGLSKENVVIGSIVGASISAAMWLMENVLVWLWVDSHHPHKKSLREIRREAEMEIKEERVIQRIQWMKWNAKKPDLSLIKEARKEDERRSRVIGDGIPEYFVLIEQEPVKQIVAEPIEPVREMGEIVPLKRPIGFHPANNERTMNIEQKKMNSEQKKVNRNKRPNKTEQVIEHVIGLIEQNEKFTVRSVAEELECSVGIAAKGINLAKEQAEVK